MTNEDDPFFWRDRSIYPDAGLVLFIRCEVDTTAHHVATWCEGNYGARSYYWRIPDPDPPDKSFPYLKDRIGVLSMMGRVVDAPPFVVVAAQMAFPAKLPDNRIHFRAPIPDGINVIEVILSEFSPPYHARTGITFKAYLVDQHVIEYLDKALDEFLDDYPTRTKCHYESHRHMSWVDSPAWEAPLQASAEAFITRLEAKGFERKKETDLDVQQAEMELAQKWDAYDVNKVFEMSLRGISIPEIARETAISPSTIKRIRATGAKAKKLPIKPRKKKPPKLQ